MFVLGFPILYFKGGYHTLMHDKDEKCYSTFNHNICVI